MAIYGTAGNLGPAKCGLPLPKRNQAAMYEFCRGTSLVLLKTFQPLYRVSLYPGQMSQSAHVRHIDHNNPFINRTVMTIFVTQRMGLNQCEWNCGSRVRSAG